jgi:hypothetical protein
MKALLALLAVASFALPFSSALAQYNAVRLIPKESVTGEGAGMTQKGLAVGGGFIAQGSVLKTHPVTGWAAGAVYLWDSQSLKQLKTLYPPAADANSGLSFGSSVAICGNRLIVGAPGGDDSFANLVDDRGTVYVYDLKTLKPLFRIQDTFFFPGDRWGETVAMDRDDLVIATPFADTHGLDAGDCRVYRLTNSIALVSPISAVPTLASGTPSPIQAGDQYGSAVAIRNGVILASSPFAAVGAELQAGRVYLMDAHGADQALSTIDNPDPSLLPVEPAAGDRFGSSVAFAGQFKIAIGTPEDDVSGVDSGSMSEYDISNVFAPVGVFKSQGLSAGDKLGTGVAGGSSMLFVSAPYYDPFGSLPNHGIIFGGVGSQPTVTKDDDNLGYAIAMGEGLLAATAPGDDTQDTNAGAVWVYRSPRPFSNAVFGFEWASKGGTAIGVGNSTHASFPLVSVTQNGIGSAAPAFVSKLAGPLTSAGIKEAVYHVQSGSITKLTNTGPGLAFLKPGSISQVIANTEETVWISGKNSSNKPVLQANSVNAVSVGSDLLFGTPGLLSAGIAKLVPGRADNISSIFPSTESTYVLPLSYKLGGAVTASNDSAVALLTGSPFFIQAREDDPTGVGGHINGQMPTRVCVNGGRVSYAQFIKELGVTAADNMIVNTNLNEIARKGPVFSAFLGESVRSDGALTNCTLFRTSLTLGGGVTPSNNEALYSDRSGVLKEIMRKGNPLPVPIVGNFKRFLAWHITLNGDCLALVQISGPGVKASNDVVLLLNRYTGAEPGMTEVLLREGDRIPGKDGARVANILKVDFTSSPGSSYYGALVSLVVEKTGATKSNNIAWLVGDATPGADMEFAARLPQVMLRKGVIMDGPVGKNTVTSIGLANNSIDISGAGNTGLPHAVGGSSGDSTLVLSYPDKSQSVFTLIDPIDLP